jgi:hypothetical protein
VGRGRVPASDSARPSGLRDQSETSFADVYCREEGRATAELRNLPVTAKRSRGQVKNIQGYHAENRAKSD